MADIFTKALGIEKLCMFRGLLGVWELDLSLRGSVEISSSTSHVMHGLVYGSCGKVRLPHMYGLGLQYGPCTLG